MASIRVIRKRHRRQMVVTVKCNAFMASHGPWSSFPFVGEAIAFLRGIHVRADGALSAAITGDGSGVSLPEIVAPRPA